MRLQAKAIEEPLYADYLKMLEANPTEFQAKDHRDGMERLKSDGNFLRTTKEAFNAMVKYQHFVYQTNSFDSMHCFIS